ncbi:MULTISPECIES: DUF937 domain-containing protein [unclassified Luteococcus]|uniref:DUF937 domain-containing protein n=1 Tax=unclassified Luteococcus TaxID=2639923 RepID=UPI00313DD2EA
MSALNDILAALPINQLASELNEDPAAVEKAAAPAVTSILGGLTQNAQNPEGELSLAQALEQHKDKELLTTDQPVDLQAVDTADGEKIIGHVFGNQTDGVAQALSSQAGVSSALVNKLLPILAPIVLSYLAKQLGGGNSAAGNILGQVLGGAGQQAGAGSANSGMLGGVLSQVLGSVLGGNAAPANNPFDTTNAQATTQQAQATGGDIVSQILGGLLGGKK